jgi:ubiquinone/menaquinone biosynthesis C-methylase UbiE
LQQPQIDCAAEIVGGCLLCSACTSCYPIRAGIADFLGPPRPPTPAQVTNEWPLTAWVYERLWRPFALTLLSGEPFPYQHELPLIAGLIEPARGGLYVDVACSNGLYARALTRTMRSAAGHVVGVDHSLPMLVQARAFARAAGLRISYLRAEAQALPLRASQAAGVVIGGSLNEIGDLNGCLAEVHRTLAPGGRYVAMTLTRASSPAGRALQRLIGASGICFWTPDDLLAHFTRSGLRTIGHWRYGIVLFTLSI